MFTIPPRQQLPFTRWLAIRARGVTRDRMRMKIRIRRITSCNNTFRERALSLNYSTFFTSFSSLLYTNTNERNIKNVHPSRALVLRERGYRPDDCICDEARAMGRSRGFYRVLDDWYVYRLNVYINTDIVMCPLLLGGLDLFLSMFCSFSHKSLSHSLSLSLFKQQTTLGDKSFAWAKSFVIEPPSPEE